MNKIEYYFKFDLPKAPDMRIAALLREALLQSCAIQVDQPLLYEIVETLVPSVNVNLHALSPEDRNDYAWTWHECYTTLKSNVMKEAAERWLKTQSN
jgi:hypothetical protein